MHTVRSLNILVNQQFQFLANAHSGVNWVGDLIYETSLCGNEGVQELVFIFLRTGCKMKHRTTVTIDASI